MLACNLERLLPSLTPSATSIADRISGRADTVSRVLKRTDLHRAEAFCMPFLERRGDKHHRIFFT